MNITKLGLDAWTGLIQHVMWTSDEL